ncbi:MAG: aspartate ammonia-lyase [Flavobacteriaceae bacterium]|nr:aspartate ammonia-lyase [Flavobacteriaceae bacterium]
MKTKKQLSLLITLLLLLVSTSTTFAQKYRTETDLLGDLKVPADAYYGAQGARGMENFQISGQYINDYPDFMKAWGMVKLAAARANTDVGKMPADMLKLIEPACQELIDGNYLDQFKLDLYQGGAGTSTNMIANEVLANIALVKAGYKKGDYDKISPNDQLNMSQSTNDAYPTSLKITMLMHNDKLIAQLKLLIKSFRKLGNDNIDIVKMGRTEFQDAVPMTVGQEFHSFAAMLEWDVTNIEFASKSLTVINMGGTAIGTGLNAPKGYETSIVKHIRDISGFDLKNADDLIAATSSLQGFVVYSSALKTLATTLSKISNDLIILSSGPRNGIFEINLPARQPGSSIMPGKVNPVIAELMAFVSYRVLGNDVTVSIAASDGDLQLNAYEPVVGLSIFESQKLLINTMKTFREQCIDGITINEEVHKRNMETTIGIVTALNPILGHHVGDELAKESMKTGKGILELVREKKLLTEKQIKEIMSPKNMTGLDKSKYKK